MFLSSSTSQKCPPRKENLSNLSIRVLLKWAFYGFTRHFFLSISRKTSSSIICLWVVPLSKRLFWCIREQWSLLLLDFHSSVPVPLFRELAPQTQCMPHLPHWLHVNLPEGSEVRVHGLKFWPHCLLAMLTIEQITWPLYAQCFIWKKGTITLPTSKLVRLNELIHIKIQYSTWLLVIT